MHADTPQIYYWWFAPDGYPVQRVYRRALEGEHVDTMTDTGLGKTSSDNYPTMKALATTSGTEVVLSSNDGEFLLRHCRRLEVSDDFSTWDYDSPPVEPWDEEIMLRCHALARVEETLALVREAVDRGYNLIDDTQKVVLDAIICSKLEAIIDEHNKAIDAYRATRVEPLVLEDDDDE